MWSDNRGLGKRILLFSSQSIWYSRRLFRKTSSRLSTYRRITRTSFVISIPSHASTPCGVSAPQRIVVRAPTINRISKHIQCRRPVADGHTVLVLSEPSKLINVLWKYTVPSSEKTAFANALKQHSKPSGNFSCPVIWRNLLIFKIAVCLAANEFLQQRISHIAQPTPVVTALPYDLSADIAVP